MQFKLNLITITTNIKVGYFILLDNGIFHVINISEDKKIVTLNNYVEYNIEFIENKVIKFLGEYKRQTYSISHGDFASIVDFLHTPIHHYNEATDTIYNNYVEAIFDNIPIIIEGKFEQIYTSVASKDTVRIKNIDIIDQHQLYDKNNRLATVVRYNKYNHTFKLMLYNSDIIKCNREDFEKIGENNLYTIVKCVCQTCNK